MAIRNRDEVVRELKILRDSSRPMRMRRRNTILSGVMKESFDWVIEEAIEYLEPKEYEPENLYCGMRSLRPQVEEQKKEILMLKQQIALLQGGNNENLHQGSL